MLGGYFILPHPVYRRSVPSSCRYFWSISACIFVHLALNCTYTTLWNTKIIFQQFTTVQWCQKSGWYLQGEVGELPPHWIWPSLPLVCLKTYRGNGKGEGGGKGKWKGGGDHLPYFPPTGFCHKYHPVRHVTLCTRESWNKRVATNHVTATVRNDLPAPALEYSHRVSFVRPTAEFASSTTGWPS